MKTDANLFLSTRHLSLNGAQVTPDEHAPETAITAPEAVTVLQAFAQTAALALVDVEARIRLRGPLATLSVQNLSGRLFAARIPESLNPATEHLPGAIVAMVTEGLAAANATAGSPGVMQQRSRWHAWVPQASKFSLGLMGAAAAALAIVWAAQPSQTPAGVVLIKDPAQIANYNSQFDGRYGDKNESGVSTLAIHEGKITGYRTNQDGRESAVFESSYHYGVQNHEPVLVMPNGATVGLQPDKSLKFLATVYPRQAE